MNLGFKFICRNIVNYYWTTFALLNCNYKHVIARQPLILLRSDMKKGKKNYIPLFTWDWSLQCHIQTWFTKIKCMDLQAGCCAERCIQLVGSSASCQQNGMDSWWRPCHINGFIQLLNLHGDQTPAKNKENFRISLVVQTNYKPCV